MTPDQERIKQLEEALRPFAKAYERCLTYDYQQDLKRRVRSAVQDMAGGAVLQVTGPGMELEMVAPVNQPEGDVVSHLIHHGWLESFSNGGGYRLSDAGKLAYLRSTDELDDGALIDPRQYQP